VFNYQKFTFIFGLNENVNLGFSKKKYIQVIPTIWYISVCCCC